MPFQEKADIINAIIKMKKPVTFLKLKNRH